MRRSKLYKQQREQLGDNQQRYSVLEAIGNISSGLDNGLADMPIVELPVIVEEEAPAEEPAAEEPAAEPAVEEAAEATAAAAIP